MLIPGEKPRKTSILSGFALFAGRRLRVGNVHLDARGVPPHRRCGGTPGGGGPDSRFPADLQCSQAGEVFQLNIGNLTFQGCFAAHFGSSCMAAGDNHGSHLVQNGHFE